MKYKIYFFLLFALAINSFVYSQTPNTSYLNFLPSSMNPSDLKPSDIPSQEVLKQMGFSASEIAKVLDYKFSAARKKPNSQRDTVNNNEELSEFYTIFNDSLKKDTMSFPPARIYGQDIFRNIDMDFYNKALDAKAPENYKVGPGDEISISVWGYSEFSENLLVDKRGYISPSVYGRIYVKGLTFRKMRSLIKSKFSSFLDMKNSEIEVALSYSRVITVNIVGEVYNPGSYSIPAINTVFNALIAAHGPNQLGSVRNIYIKRNGNVVDSLDVYKFLFDPMNSNDIYLEDGDYIIVPPASNIVEITGSVNRPYTYESKNGETVEELINYAGGYATDAYLDIISLSRKDYSTRKVYDVHKDDISSTVILNGDYIVVNNISNRLSNMVSVQSSIGVSGNYEYIKGERLLDLLKRAKCIDQETFLEKVYIIRTDSDKKRTHININLQSILNNPKNEDNIILNEYDKVFVLSLADFEDVFSVSVFGAVRNPGEFEFGEGMTLQDVLLRSHGLMQTAENSKIEISRVMEYDVSTNSLSPKKTIIKTIKVNNNLEISELAEQFLLEPYDQIYVRENPDYKAPENITIEGEVKYPGQYSILRKNERVSSFVSRSGGLTSYAYVEGAKIYRKKKVTYNLNKDELYIPEIVLDSIINDPELALIYEREILLLQIKNLLNLNMQDTILYEVVTFDMKTALEKPFSSNDIVLQEGDKVFIPEHLDVVNIRGSVQVQGGSISAPFSGKRANYYIRNYAGGFTKENKKSLTTVTYPNGQVKKSINFGLFSVSPKVQPGSIINLASDDTEKRKKKEDIDYNRHIESIIIKITGIMSLYLLIDRISSAQ